MLTYLPGSTGNGIGGGIEPHSPAEFTQEFLSKPDFRSQPPDARPGPTREAPAPLFQHGKRKFSYTLHLCTASRNSTARADKTCRPKNQQFPIFAESMSRPCGSGGHLNAGPPRQGSPAHNIFHIKKRNDEGSHRASQGNVPGGATFSMPCAGPSPSVGPGTINAKRKTGTNLSICAAGPPGSPPSGNGDHPGNLSVNSYVTRSYKISDNLNGLEESEEASQILSSIPNSAAKYQNHKANPGRGRKIGSGRPRIQITKQQVADQANSTIQRPILVEEDRQALALLTLIESKWISNSQSSKFNATDQDQSLPWRIWGLRNSSY